MLYPMIFEPIYKQYLWGGRNLEKLGRTLPEGKAAESWEITCRPEGISILSNGELKGKSLQDLINDFGRELMGNEMPEEYLRKFPLLVKFIDANDDLSIQVHPDDRYAKSKDSYYSGKNEAWYFLNVEKGAKIIHGIKPGITREMFKKKLDDGKILECMNHIDVSPGDVISNPAGMVHSIGRGIMLVEIQQNSDQTYRLYDYDRTDEKGIKRPLHIQDALNVMDFKNSFNVSKIKGLEVKICSLSTKTFAVANRFYSMEIYRIDGIIEENAGGRKFYIYICIEGEGTITYFGHDRENNLIKFTKGTTIFIPASLGKYSIEGKTALIKTYVPDIEKDIVQPLLKAGCSKKEIDRLAK